MMALDRNSQSKLAANAIVFEFFSGIGGMRYGLTRAMSNFPAFSFSDVCFRPFEINDTSNAIYSHNFGDKVPGNEIRRVTPEVLDNMVTKYDKSMGLQKDTGDNRAEPFLHLMQCLTHLKCPPDVFLLENVRGFEKSDSRDVLLSTLRGVGYDWKEFLLSPTQLGIPNQRSRYFMVAVKKSNKLGIRAPPGPSDLEHPLTQIPGNNRCAPDDSEENTECAPLSTILEQVDPVGPDASEEEIEEHPYAVPLNILLKKGMMFDIVSASSRRTKCFTKAYSRFVEGTGSVFQSQTQHPPVDLEDSQTLRPLGIRYFTPKEVANLHSFPTEFNFPSSVSRKQAYMVLGNSLNVAVVAALFEYAIVPES